mgnify:CR=1 FL=1
MSLKRFFIAMMAIMVVAAVGCGSKPSTDATPAPNEDAQAATKPITQVAVPGEAGTEEAAAPEVAPETPLPEIVARVGDATITGKELSRQTKYMESMGASRGMPITVTDEQRGEILDDMVNQKVLEQAAEKSGMAPTDEEVSAFVAQTKEQIPAGQFEQVLDQMGLTEDEFVKATRTMMMSRKYLDDLTKDITVTDEDVAAEYEILKTSGQLERPEETVDVAHILIRVKDGADDETWQKAKENIDAAHARVKAGEEFAAVAKDVSQDPGSAQRGGLYQGVGKGQLVPEFDEIMFTMEPGAVSEPFKTKFGWHVLTVVKKNAPGTIPLDEVKDGLQKELLSTRQQKAVLDKVDELREATNVEILYHPADNEPASDEAPAVSDEAPVETAAPATEEAQ